MLFFSCKRLILLNILWYLYEGTEEEMDSFVQLLNVLFSPKMFDEHLEYGLEIRLG